MKLAFGLMIALILVLIEAKSKPGAEVSEEDREGDYGDEEPLKKLGIKCGDKICKEGQSCAQAVADDFENGADYFYECV